MQSINVPNNCPSIITVVYTITTCAKFRTWKPGMPVFPHWRVSHLGHAQCPPIFLANYILYGVFVVICKYIPIKQVCMTIFRPPRFSPAALWLILVQNDVILDQNRLKQQRLIISVKIKVWTRNLVRILILLVKFQK